MSGKCSDIELKKWIYEVEHVLRSDVEDSVKWMSVDELRRKVLKCPDNISMHDLLCLLLTLPITSSHEIKIVQDFFLNGNNCDSFLVLMRSLHNGVNAEKILDLLEKFTDGSNLMDMILNQCTLQQKGVGYLFSQLWDELVSLLVSLPERIGNKFKLATRTAFQPTVYLTHLLSSIYSVLHQVHDWLSQGKDTSLEFLSKLLGKLCISGYAEITFDYLCGQLVKVTKNNFLWRRICQRLILGVPMRCMETVLKSLLKRLTWYGQVEWFLGDSVNTCQTIQYLLTTKFLIVCYFEKNELPQNVIGYLAQSTARINLFYKIITTLLDVWSDRSALNHQTYLQQLYLTRLLMICTGHLKIHGVESYKQEYLNKLMQGVHNHIGSSHPDKRVLGMVVAEAMCAVLDPDGPKLKFEHDLTEEVNSLNSLVVVPELVETEEKQEETVEKELACNNLEQLEKKESECLNDEDQKISECLDSDDDLEPYDFTTEANQKKQPLYLQECKIGLMDEKNPEWTEACLESAEKLIRRSPDNLEEEAIDLCKILLHLEDSFATSNFVTLRLNTLVALCVHCPIQIASLLSMEFYGKNYNIRQRLDILQKLRRCIIKKKIPNGFFLIINVTMSLFQVLSSASRELSGIKSDQDEAKTKAYVQESKFHMEETWRDIIQKRVASKTKIISKGRREQISKENNFSLVAGYFFFPLLAQFDKTDSTFNLLGEDSLLLGHLIYTLGIIMNCAVNTTIAFQMGKCLLEFIWVFKYYNDKFVQKALLFALCMVIASVPSYFLLTDLQDDVLECQYWLQDIIHQDDPDSTTMASQVFGLLRNILKEEGVTMCL